MKIERLKRRPRGSGCVYKRKDGRWEGRIPRDELLPPIYVYARTRKAVQDKMFARQREPALYDPEHLTVAQWLDHWLRMVEDERAYSTYLVYKNAVHHMLPSIGSIKLSRLGRDHVWTLLDALKAKGLGPRVRQQVHSTLHRALNVAMRRGKVATNACQAVDKPCAQPKPARFLSTEREVQRFREAARGSPYEALFVTILDTGARSGELRALTWDCVDLNQGRILIRSTLTKNEQGELVATKTKTRASIRTVLLTAETTAMLRDHRKRQIGSRWVFPAPNGKPTPRDGLLRSEFRRVLRRAGLPSITLHGLRHTHATLLNVQGVNRAAIQERLGWASGRMLETYAHPTSTIQAQAVAAWDAVSRQISRQTDETAISSKEKTGRDALPDAG